MRHDATDAHTNGRVLKRTLLGDVSSITVGKWKTRNRFAESTNRTMTDEVVLCENRERCKRIRDISENC